MPRHDPYTMEVDKGRNCYNCGKFGLIARNCRNWKIMGQEKILKYENNLNNLNEEESLVVLN